VVHAESSGAEAKVTDVTNQRQRPASEDHQRTSLLALGWVTAFLAALHLVDHALRGARLDEHRLPAIWDHSGWPFQDHVTPYTFSLIAVALILGVGLLGTHRGWLWAGYWLGAATLLGGIVIVVHFLPTEHQESPHVIYGSWDGQPIIGVLAVANTFAIVAVLTLMMLNAIRVARASHHWL
jgi:hypothetical protein